jgi:RND family efflux transporter MFP subunit
MPSDDLPAGHDTTRRGAPPSGAEFPDDVARTEQPGVATTVDPGTDAAVKRGVILLVIVLAVGFLAVRGVRFFHERALERAGRAATAAPPPVDVIVARPAAAGQGLVLPGQTAAWFESIIYARVSGYVARWAADIGDHVRKGQVLATLDTPELDAELSAARAELKAAEAQVVARQAEAEFSKTTHERWRDSPQGVVSDQERAEKRADYEAAVARLYAANAQVALDQARVDQYRTLAEFKQVTAPYDGTITERRIDVGNLVTAGSTSATTPLYRMSQSDPLRVFVDVPQSLAGELMQTGVPAEIRASGIAAGSVTGKVARVADAIDAHARTMRVEVDIPNAQHALVPGMYVNVAFKLHPKGLVEVPAAALIFRPGAVQVARVNGSNHVEFCAVTIAGDNGSLVELASGVAPGDRLVLNVSGQIVAGQEVSVKSSSEPAAAGSAPAAAGGRGS